MTKEVKMRKYAYRGYHMEKGIELIKKYEGCVLKAYKCPAGVWTIGYGTTTNVKEGDVITEEQAEAMLVRDVNDVCRKLYELTKHYPLTENQFNALVSFFYNLGFSNRIATRLKVGVPIDEVLMVTKLYVNAKGKPLAGLIKRRQEEYLLAVS